MLEIIRGIAGSGKTECCLREYRQTLKSLGSQGRLGEVLWLVPTHRSVQQVLARLPHAELPCCFAPGVMTFDQFAERVLRGAEVPSSILNSSERRMLVKSVISTARQAGQLKYFREVSESRGFASQVGRFIAELKREETWPEQLRDSLSHRTAHVKDEELVLLYELYQQKLHAWNKYDSEGRYWLARTELAAGHWQAFPRLSRVVVTGFTDFTQTQQEMLILLAGHAEQIWISLPGEQPGQLPQQQGEISPWPAASNGSTPVDSAHAFGTGREELFAKPDHTANLLEWRARKADIETRRRLQIQPSSGTETAQARLPAGLDWLARMLFVNPRGLEPAADAAGVTCLAALGARAEVREVARRVKSLLLRGVPAEEILVAARPLEGHATLLETEFADAGIPHVLPRELPVSTLPLARGMGALLESLHQDWSFASLKKLLRHTPLQWSDWWNSAERCREVLRVLRRLNLRGGRQEILELLTALATRPDAAMATTAAGGEEQEDLDEAAREAEEHSSKWRGEYARACETLQRLDQSLTLLTKGGTYQQQTRQLLAVSRDLFLSARNPSDASAEESVEPGDLQAEWDLLAGLLLEGAEFQDQLAGDQPVEVSWTDYAEWLEDQFRFQSLSPRKGQPGEVRILDAADARHIRVQHLFVMGLLEGSFPSRGDQQLFYSDQERREWNEAGIPLAVRSRHHQEELQFFYQLVTRAETTLTLSYSRVSNKGAPQYASPFLQALRSLYHPEALAEQAIGQLSPVPEPGDLLTETDCRLQGVLGMQARQPGLLCWWGTRPETKKPFYSLLGVARMNSARFEQQGFTSYEGLLQQPANRAYLATRFHPEYLFSASRLEAYATCPFRFLLQQVLDIEPLSVPHLATDHLSRGNLIHDLLAVLHAEAEGILSDSAGLTTRFRELLQQHFEQRYARGELQRALDELEQQLLSEWAELYAAQVEQYVELARQQQAPTPQPRYLELSFGRARDAEQTPGETASSSPTSITETTPHAEETNPESLLPPVSFGQGAERVLTEGRIDRIDINEVQGTPVYTIIDYKTGKPPAVKPDQVSRGTKLQLALYAVAVARLELLGPDAQPWLVGYWGVRDQGFLPQFKEGRTQTTLTADFLQRWGEVLDELLPRLVKSLRMGELPVFNEDDKCKQYCPYRTVCRVNDVRGVADRLGKQWTLQALTSTETAALESASED